MDNLIMTHESNHVFTIILNGASKQKRLVKLSIWSYVPVYHQTSENPNTRGALI